MELDRTLGLLLLAGAGGMLAFKAFNEGGGSLTSPKDLSPPDHGAASRPATGPRGIRNNNPGNIRPTLGVIPWKGQAGVDSGYVIFESPAYGIRAIFKNLQSYYNLHGVRTIQQIANRWAPKGDNNEPENYAKILASVSGLASNRVLNLLDFATVSAIARGMTVAENGGSYSSIYTPTVYVQAWGLM